MKIKYLKTYKAFVADGRHYYPRIENDRLILPHFSINADKGGNHNKRVLITVSNVIYNILGFMALYYEWYSCQGLCIRWFYWRDGKRVTWRNLTWDERRKVSKAYYKASLCVTRSSIMHSPSKMVWQFLRREGLWI